MGTLGRIWVGAAGLCFGTFLGTVIDAPELPVVGIAVAAAACAIRRRPLVALTALTSLAIGTGMLNAQVRLGSAGPLETLAREVPRCEVHGTILESVGSMGVLVLLGDARCTAVEGRDLGLAAVRDGSGAPGAAFVAEGWLVPLGHESFDLTWRRAGAEAELHVVEMQVVSPPAGLHGVAERVRDGLSGAVSPLSPRVGGLIKGLTIGDTSGLDPTTIERFRNAGLSHVLAVSGSNVAIVLGAILVGAKAAGHRFRVALGYVGLGLFALVVGPDPSVLRAVAMGSITLACLAYGRTAEPLGALGLAVMAVVALRPGMLFSVGMQLSAAATAGIVVFSGGIERAIPVASAGFRTMVAATLAAQIAVAPILILVFGEISLIAPLANALALPAVGPGTVIGLAAGTLAVFLPDIGRMLGKALGPIGAWILLVADRTGGLRWSVVSVPPALGWLLLVGVVWLGVAALREGVDGSR